MFIERVISALSEYKVRYALVGGYAVALHGAVRGTVDVDIVISMNKKSFRQAEIALNSIGLTARLPVNANEVFDFREEYIQNRNMTAWSFINLNNPLEIVDIIITEDASTFKTVNKKFNQMTIKVASVNDLITMKQKSARPQDLEDIKALKALAGKDE